MSDSRVESEAQAQLRELIADVAFYLQRQDIKFASGKVDSMWNQINSELRERIEAVLK